MYEEPLARVLAIQEIGSTLVVTVTIEAQIHPPLAPSSLHPVMAPNQMLMELHRAVERSDNQFTFHSYNSDEAASHLAIGETYVFRTWWRPDQLLLAQDMDRLWNRQTFEAIDAVETILPEGTRILRPFRATENIEDSDSVVHTGWDHEHCTLCWQRISALEGDEPVGYSSEGEWVCETCYQRYIKSGLGRILGDQASV